MNNNEETMNKYAEYLNNIRQIQSNVLTINEDDEEKSNDELDDLLKDDGGDDEKKDDNDGGDDLGDLGGDDEKKDDDDGGDDLGDLGGDDEEGGDDLDLEAGNDGEKESFETDNEGLMDTITKLTKSGHTVKIIVSAENNQPMLSIDGKKASLKQLQKLLNESSDNDKSNKNDQKKIKQRKKIEKNSSSIGSEKVNNKLYKSLMEQINILNKKFDKLNKKDNIEPVIEEKFIQIKESDYNALIEMAEDMNYKIDEQESLIKNYESMNNFNAIDEEADQELNEILNDLNESVDELNRVTILNKMQNIKSSSFSRGTDISLGIISEDIMPILSYINSVKALVLSEIDKYEYNSYSPKKITNKKSNNMKLNEGINIMKNINNGNNVKSLLESKLKDNKKYNKNEIMNILDEITSTIAIADTEYGYESSIQKPEIPPTKSITNSINKALSTSKGTKSIIQDIPEENWDFQQKAQNTKSELPIMNYSQITTPTIKSAIANLTESLTDIDGNIDLKLCEQAYLYKRVKNPQSFKDFAMPIAIMEQKSHKLYAHPKLIENVANILKSDACIKTYNIDSRETLYALRESLIPYLRKIGMEAPWLQKSE